MSISSDVWHMVLKNLNYMFRTLPTKKFTSPHTSSLRSLSSLTKLGAPLFVIIGDGEMMCSTILANNKSSGPSVLLKIISHWPQAFVPPISNKFLASLRYLQGIACLSIHFLVSTNFEHLRQTMLKPGYHLNRESSCT